jgi:hypothetical protein
MRCGPPRAGIQTGKYAEKDITKNPREQAFKEHFSPMIRIKAKFAPFILSRELVDNRSMNAMNPPFRPLTSSERAVVSAFLRTIVFSYPADNGSSSHGSIRLSANISLSAIHG